MYIIFMTLAVILVIIGLITFFREEAFTGTIICVAGLGIGVLATLAKQDYDQKPDCTTDQVIDIATFKNSDSIEIRFGLCDDNNKLYGNKKIILSPEEYTKLFLDR